MKYTPGTPSRLFVECFVSVKTIVSMYILYIVLVRVYFINNSRVDSSALMVGLTSRDTVYHVVW